ncbi:MAG TPA: hydrogenase subunit MbhD domain-containing protein [Gaiellaceae bacterium]|nr:hydrogenase subunit MbhD domain-containing protein [Gaiellaceae bacterium]
MIPLQAVLIGLSGLGALLVVLQRDLVRQAILLSLYGLALTALFLVLQAPDVALSELVVGGIAYPLVLVAAIARVRAKKKQ